MQTNSLLMQVTRIVCAAALLCGSFIATAQTHSIGSASAGESFENIAATEQFDNALSLIEARAYKEALAQLRRLQATYPGFNKLSSVQTRISVLQEADDAGPAIVHYLDALNRRDNDDVVGALSALDFVLVQYKDSSLIDDAMYLKAYVQVMDRYDFEAARTTLEQLIQTFPESSYQDSAEYLDAIALEQMGETALAKARLEALRDKHTAVALPFGFNWPNGNVLSRYWYDRADQRIAIISRSGDNASRMRSKQTDKESNSLHVQVNVDGVDFEFMLQPSPLTMQAGWLDGFLQDRSPPAAGVYMGYVVGDSESWVRAVIQEDSITGMALAFGQSYTMQPGTLIGTLDYYQPRSARTRSANSPDSISTEAHLHIDGLELPPEAPLDVTRRSAPKIAAASDLRVVPISIVIDAEFDRYHGGNGLITALNQLNVADGIYRQFGIALSVDEVQVFSDEDDNPMHSASAPLETFLKSFRDYRLKNRTLFADSSLTYLFTGKQRTDRTLGLAWIDTLCRTDGYDVGVTTPSAIGGVLLTHEIGHSLGSEHDSDTGCNQDSSKIMWPHISSRTQIEFSNCSVNMLEAARSKTCLIDAIDLAIDANGSDAGVDLELSNLDSTVVVDATLSVETSSADLLDWPAGCNRVSPTSANCAVGTMAAGEKRVVFFPLNTGVQSSNAFVTAKLTPVGTQDFTPANNVATYSFGGNSTTVNHLAMSAEADTNSANSFSSVQNDTNAPAAANGSFSLTALLTLLMLQLIRLMKLQQQGLSRVHFQ